MTNIIYTSKAKDDLAKINWRTRERIITLMSNLSRTSPRHTGFIPMHDSEFMRLNYDNHVIIGKMEDRELSILTIQKKLQIKLPEQD